MRKKVITGIIISNVILILGGLLSFITNRYFISYIGLPKLGLDNLFKQLLGYLNLAEMGLSTASTYALYKPLMEKDYQRINEVIYTMKQIYKKVMLFIFVAGVLCTFLLPFFMKGYAFSPEVVLYWLMYIINTLMSYLVVIYLILYNADQKYNFVKIVQGSTQIIFQIIKIAIIIIFKSFFLILVLGLINTVVNLLIFRIYYQKEYEPKLQPQAKYQLDRTIIKDIKNIFIHKLSFVLSVNTDIILISTFISLSVVGLYSSYLMVLGLWLKVVGSVADIARSNIGSLNAVSSKQEVYQKFQQLNIIYLYFTVLVIVPTYYLIQPFMNLWINKQLHVKGLVLLLCLNYGMKIYRGCLDIFKETGGFFDDIHLPILEGGLNFIISLILVQKIGLIGVLIGTVVSDLLITYIYKPILVYQRCFAQQIQAYLHDYLRYVVYVVLAAGSSYLVMKNYAFEIKTAGDFVLQGIIIFGINAIITTVVFLGDRNFRYDLKELKMIKRPN